MSGDFPQGTTAALKFTAGSASAVGSGSYTLAALFQPKAGNNNASIMSAYNGTTAVRSFFEDTNHLFGDGDFSAGYGTLTQGNWYLVVQTKAAGANTYRMHYWQYNSSATGSFSHGVATSAGTHTDPGSVTELRIGAGVTNANSLTAVGAWWTRVLSDAEIDTMVSTALTSWRDVSGGAPAELIHLKNWNGTSGATIAIGTSSFSSMTGSVGVGADPPSFDFTLSSGLTIGHAGTPSAEQFGTHVLSPSTGLFVPASIVSQERFGSGVISAGTASAVPGSVPSVERFGSALITPGTSSAVPGVVQSNERFGSGAVAPSSTATVGQTGISSGEIWGSASLANSAGAPQSFAPGTIGSLEQFGTDILTPGTSTFAPGSIAPTEQFGTGAMSATSVANAPGAIGPQERWGSATVGAGIGVAAPGSVTPGERWGSSSLVGSPSVIAPGTIGPCEKWGSTALGLNAAILFAPGSAHSGERWGTSFIEYAARTTTHTVNAGAAKFEVELESQIYTVKYNRKLVEVEVE